MSVLISGASMAGLSLAYWLDALGEDVVVVERAPALRRAGSPIDVRGEALDVAARMGILDELRARRVISSDRTAFTTWVDRDGAPVAVLPAEAATDSADDVEIARDRLVDLLHEAIGARVEFRYGDHIDAASDEGSSVRVRFASGAEQRFDHLVGADGIHSGVRRATFGPESDYRHHLGVYFAIVDLPRGAGTPHESLTYNTPGRMYCITDYGDRTLGYLAFRAPELTYDHRSVEAQKAVILSELRGETGWQVPLLLDAVREAEDLYFDSVSQVRMTGWARGRIVLAGDAAHAAALFSGRGTSLAMLGAYFLAEELRRADGDHATAFTRYEQRLRPYVERAQAGVPETRDFMVPATAGDLAARNLRFAVEASR